MHTMICYLKNPISKQIGAMTDCGGVNKTMKLSI